jgi:antirestriction protein ArdC
MPAGAIVNSVAASATLAYAMEELVAELGAAFLCEDLLLPARRARITLTM